MKKQVKYFKFLTNTIVLVVIAYGIAYLADQNVTKTNRASNDAESEINSFVAIDEEGDIAFVPYTEVETPPYELLQGIDNQSYEVVVDGIQQGEAEEYSEAIDLLNTFDHPMETKEIIPVTKGTVKNGVVVFKNTNPLVNTNYVNARTRAPGYLNATYAPDAAYLGTVNDNGVLKVVFKQSGVIGMVKAEEVHVVDYDQFVKAGMISSYFEVKNGKLYHNITTNLKRIASTQLFGYKQDYMQEGKRYYSYDGHYFYENYKDMTADYCTGKFASGLYYPGTYKRAINADEPYYNYFMYLSQRSKTKVTATQLNQYLSSHKAYKETSKLKNTGKYFIENQNKYGVNALIMFASAINESAYGNSSIAQKKNNLFGHGASDAYPSYGAVGYGTPQASITDHAKVYISKGYTDPKDSRYFGPHLGNKESGANVCYASDSYWGEKAAAQCFHIVDYFRNSMKELNAYNLGVSSKKVQVYNRDGRELYNSIGGKGGVIQEYPVIILGEKDGMYRIQSDAPLDFTGLKLQQTVSNGDTGIYEFKEDTLFAKKSVIQNLHTNTSVNPEGPPQLDYVLGDASGDKKVTSLDYVQIKNHIMGIKLLKGERLKAADASQDGEISSLDYIKVKNHIMGVKPLVKMGE